MFELELNLTNYLLMQNWYWDLLLNKSYTNTNTNTMEDINV